MPELASYAFEGAQNARNTAQYSIESGRLPRYDDGSKFDEWEMSTKQSNALSVETNVPSTRSAHLDVTTIFGAIDALKLLPETADLPTSLHIVTTFAQFIDAIVLQDRLLYESSPNKLHEPYAEIIDRSRLVDHIGSDILTDHTSPIHEDDVRQSAIEWAVEVATKIEKQDVEYALAPRESVYRCVEVIHGIRDRTNLYTTDLLSIAKESGTSRFHDSLDKARFRIGDMGLHVLARNYMLHEWLAKTQTVSYLPHYSRVPLAKKVLPQQVLSRNFVSWSLAEVSKHRRAIIESVTDQSERGDFDFSLSPIFLACLPDARYPLDILDKALQLRESVSAKKLRKLCRGLEDSKQVGIDATIEIRANLLNALTAFSDDLASLPGSAKLKLSLPIGVKIEQTFLTGRLRPGVAFFVDVLSLSMNVVNAQAAIENLFGKLDKNKFWLVSGCSASHRSDGTAS